MNQYNEFAKTADRPDYARLAQAYKDPVARFIADKILPAFGVETEIGKHRYMPEKTWYDRSDTTLAPSGLPNEVDYSDSFRDYNLQKFGLSKFFRNEELAQPKLYGAASSAQMIQEAIEFVSYKIRLDKECRVADFFANTANYESGFYGAPAVKWDSYSTSDPLKDVITYKQKLLGEATDMIITDDVLFVLQQHPKINAATTVMGSKRDGSVNPLVTVEFLQNYFGIPRITIAAARVNSASDTTITSTLIKCWTDNVFISCINPASAESQLAATFAKQLRLNLQGFSGTEGFVVREHDNPRAGGFGGKHIDVLQYMTPWIHSKKLGAMITDVLGNR